MINALLSVVYYWPDKGGMFVGPRADHKESEPKASVEDEAKI
eukprot:CAMPEP_0197879422 /NCGR_PEP_ID=MMETSP1439-20131203/7520_1 /TAXON_ID=66791 /ORGANISM="Gonyaulax spinifera, Strain CCMP409" /LENGTH=41 /DNA_ID= /DNA_START= /DNA_END= /DNA_ORIENTATION=